jgi:hypothetical protein
MVVMSVTAMVDEDIVTLVGVAVGFEVTATDGVASAAAADGTVDVVSVSACVAVVFALVVADAAVVASAPADVVAVTAAAVVDEKSPVAAVVDGESEDTEVDATRSVPFESDEDGDWELDLLLIIVSTEVVSALSGFCNVELKVSFCDTDAAVVVVVVIAVVVERGAVVLDGVVIVMGNGVGVGMVGDWVVMGVMVIVCDRAVASAVVGLKGDGVEGDVVDIVEAGSIVVVVVFLVVEVVASARVGVSVMPIATIAPAVLATSGVVVVVLILVTGVVLIVVLVVVVGVVETLIWEILVVFWETGVVDEALTSKIVVDANSKKKTETKNNNTR